MENARDPTTAARTMGHPAGATAGRTVAAGSVRARTTGVAALAGPRRAAAGMAAAAPESLARPTAASAVWHTQPDGRLPAGA